MEGGPKVVVVGAGAIGMSIAAWLAPHYEGISLLARGGSYEIIKKNGIRTYAREDGGRSKSIGVDVIRSISNTCPPEIVMIAVKNYDLESTCREIRSQLGGHQPIIVSLQNGVWNQRIMPEHFSRVIYGVICYNAWRDGPGVVGHDPKGYIIIGARSNDLDVEMDEVKSILDLGSDCMITDRINDAAHCKLVINLANPLMTLVGYQEREMTSYGVLGHMTLNLYKEGIGLLQRAGFHKSVELFLPSHLVPCPELVLDLGEHEVATTRPHLSAEDAFHGREHVLYHPAQRVRVSFFPSLLAKLIPFLDGHASGRCPTTRPCPRIMGHLDTGLDALAPQQIEVIRRVVTSVGEHPLYDDASSEHLLYELDEDGAITDPLVRDDDAEHLERHRIDGDMRLDEAASLVPVITKPLASKRGREARRVDRDDRLSRRNDRFRLLARKTLPDGRMVRRFQTEHR